MFSKSQVSSSLMQIFTVLHDNGYLPAQSLLHLSQASSSINALLAGRIQDSIVFRIPRGQRPYSVATKRVIITTPESILPCMTQITFTSGFNDPLDDILPLTLTHLTLGPCFNHSLDHIPPLLTHLSFFSLLYGKFTSEAKSAFNRAIDHLPHTLVHLSLSEWFNQPIDHLPISLRYLRLGEYFQQPIDHLPASLNHLIIDPIAECEAGYYGYHAHFCYPMDHLPASLTHLTIDSHSYKYPLDHLPHTLTHLSIKEMECLPIDHLPPSLISLTCCRKHPLEADHLPTSLLFLSIDRTYSIDHLPPLLTHLTVKHSNVCFDNLPNGLTHLEFTGDTYNKAFDHLPASLKSLKFTLEDCGVVLNYLPPNLEELRIHSGHSYTNTLNRDLPLSLKVLEVNGYASVGVLPPSIVCLALGTFVNANNLTSLPPSIIDLSLSEAHERRYLISKLTALPPTLKSLTLKGKSLEKPAAFFPQSLTHLSCNGRLGNISKLHSLINLEVNSAEPNFSSSVLSTLILGDQFNEKLNQLPHSLTFLEIGNVFNQPLKNLPPKLTHLSLGNAFNSPIILPSSLTHLVLGESFNRPILLPHRLTHLTLGEKFNQDTQFPSSLIYLRPIKQNSYRAQLPFLHVHSGDSLSDKHILLVSDELELQNEQSRLWSGNCSATSNGSDAVAMFLLAAQIDNKTEPIAQYELSINKPFDVVVIGSFPGAHNIIEELREAQKQLGIYTPIIGFPRSPGFHLSMDDFGERDMWEGMLHWKIIKFLQ